MKHFLTLTAVFLTLISGFAVFSQNAPSLPKEELPEKQFRVGERLTYNIVFANYSNAGFAELQSTRNVRFKGKNALQLRTRIFTLEPVKSTLYDLNYEAVSLLEPKTGQTLKFRRTLKVNYAEPEIFERDFTLAEVPKEVAGNGESSINTTASPEAQTLDLLSAIYRIRDLDFENNKSHILKVSEGEKVYDLTLNVAGKQKIKTAPGETTCFLIDLRTNDESLNKMLPQIFITDDARRLPVLMRLKLPMGQVRVEIAGATVSEPKPNVLPLATPTPRPVFVRPTPRPTPAPPKYVPNAPLPNDLPFALGEKLNYQLYLQNQPASIGTISLQVKERNKFFNNQDGVLLTATAANLSPSAKQILTADDAYIAYVNPENLLPQKSEIRLKGSLAAFNQTLYFNQTGGFVADDKAASVQIPNGTYDFLSLVYSLRTFRYAVKENHRVSFFTRQSPDVLTISALRREVLEINGVKVPAVLLAIQTDSPNPDQYNIRLWLSDDFQRLPLKLTAQTALGQIRAELQFEIKTLTDEETSENQ